MNLLIGISLTFTLIAFLFLIRAARCIRHGRLLRAVTGIRIPEVALYFSISYGILA